MMKNSIDAKIDELADWEVERLARVFKTTSDVLTDKEHDSLLQIFLCGGITPFDVMSERRIDLEYEEMVETKMEAWGK